MFGAYFVDGKTRTYNDYRFSGELAGTVQFSYPTVGVWLVEDDSMNNTPDVPDTTDVPAPLALSSLALLGLGLTRRKKVN